MPESQKPNALVLIFDGVEEMEAIAPIDILRRADVDVTIASLQEKSFVLGRNGIKIIPDTSLSSIDPSAFKLLVLPGGPGVMDLVDNEELRQILKNRSNAKQLTAAICAAPKALAHAGLLENRQATSHASVAASIPNYSNAPVVEDDTLITSQGAGTATAFALKLAALLTTQKKADEIAQSIHAST